ncbi:MAG: hypothetical protein IJ817_01020 [Clostridia bacterium]|nr:hypothetical protein [Clostridia bacterium]
MSTKKTSIFVYIACKTDKINHVRKINIIFQEILKTLAIFLLYFIWMRYFIRNLFLSAFLSSVLSVGTYLLLAVIKNKRKKKIGLKIKEKEDAENMFLSLTLDKKPITFFASLARRKHKLVSQHKSYVTIDYPIEKAKTLLCFDASYSGLTANKVAEIEKSAEIENANKIVICCKEIAEKEVYSFCAALKTKIVILDVYESYEKLYKEYDFYPKITHTYTKSKSMTVKDFISYSFNKKRTKGYLFSALILVLSSLFMRQTIYYCMIASILVVFSIISHFNPYFNKNEGEVI